MYRSEQQKPRSSYNYQGLKAQTGQTWGRDRDVTILTIIACLFLLIFCPMLVVYVWSSCTYYHCSLVGPIFELVSLPWTKMALRQFFTSRLPQFNWTATLIHISWIIFQGILYAFVPANIGYGQRTPAGYLLSYKLNGFRIWVFCNILFIVGSMMLGWFPASIIHDYWGGILLSTIMYGYFLSAFAYVKAHLFPSHPEDRKFSGSVIYDFMMGIEFNPRFGKLWDFKLFHNGRPGFVAWSLINMSFAAAQYKKFGYVSNSMVAVIFLHALYTFDFFYFEDWYLRTIDIAHDHFGFYLAWGTSVWFPFMYPLQSHYLSRNPIQLSPLYFWTVIILGVIGYLIFRGANNQKDIVRRSDGTCLVWGRKPKIIRPEYVTSDGKKHKSILLASGYWGVARHFNYFGDLLLSLAMCLACGFDNILAYFYIIYMTVLLLHRTKRDDTRCRGKYGKFWEEYCKLVPYKLIPYIY
ncbi:uncharacterized protein VTP21DRAFT_9635 [Calcarisporiella thermophila]|uniref:uncharacterized protein n=1 Tax=Calcarisporiella thermophila TaxID=911321 RepID=UPI00374264D8